MKASITNTDTEGIDRLYSVEVTADFFGVSPWTIRKWIIEGKIKSCKLGSRRLVPRSEINRLIAESVE